MSDWTANELDKIGAADELQIAALRSDGLLRPYTMIWVVRVGDDLYVRSYRERRGGWFRHALARAEGRIRAGGVDRTVVFEEPGDADHHAVDQAYRRKYARYGAARTSIRWCTQTRPQQRCGSSPADTCYAAPEPCRLFPAIRR